MTHLSRLQTFSVVALVTNLIRVSLHLLSRDSITLFTSIIAQLYSTYLALEYVTPEL